MTIEALRQKPFNEKVSSKTDIKDNYGKTAWERGNNRVGVVQAWLKLLGIQDTETRGFGTDTNERLEGFHQGKEEKNDLYSPSTDIWFEVTGTPWLKSESGRRYGKPMLTILKAKVDWAERYNFAGKLIFVAVADIMGELRLMPCPKVRGHSFGYYARGEGDYYFVPWEDWLQPCHIVPRLVKARLQG